MKYFGNYEIMSIERTERKEELALFRVVVSAINELIGPQAFIANSLTRNNSSLQNLSSTSPILLKKEELSSLYDKSKIVSTKSGTRKPQETNLPSIR